MQLLSLQFSQENLEIREEQFQGYLEVMKLSHIILIKYAISDVHHIILNIFDVGVSQSIPRHINSEKNNHVSAGKIPVRYCSPQRDGGTPLGTPVSTLQTCSAKR
jgi:hypothetical protein